MLGSTAQLNSARLGSAWLGTAWVSTDRKPPSAFLQTAVAAAAALQQPLVFSGSQAFASLHTTMLTLVVVSVVISPTSIMRTCFRQRTVYRLYSDGTLSKDNEYYCYINVM